MNSPLAPNQPYDDQGDQGDQPLSARERANQRWGMGPSGNSGGDKGGDSPPDLKLLKGGGETTPPRDFRTAGNDDKTADADTLSSSEDAAAGDQGDQVGSGYNAGADRGERNGLSRISLSGNSQGKGFWNKRRAGGAGIASATLVIVATLIIGTLSGPVEFLKITAGLSHALAKNDSDMSDRINEIFTSTVEEYAIGHFTGGAAKTKAQLVAVKVFGNPVTQLDDLGVTFDRHIVFGQAMKINFDTSKLKKLYPELGDMDAGQAKDFLANLVSTDKLTVQPDKFTGADGKYSLDLKGFGVGALGTLGSNVGAGTLAQLDSGKTGAWIQVRILKSFLGFSSFVLHPLNRLEAEAENKIINGTAAQRQKAAKQADEQQFNERNAAFAEEMEPLVTEAANKNSLYNSVVSKILLYTGFLCFIHATAATAEAMNYLAATQSVAEAFYRNAIGGQIEANSPDITQEQLAVDQANLTDSKGHDYFSGRAYQMLSDGQYYTGSYDIPAIYQQVYASNATARAIKSGADDALGGSFVAGIICSPTGVVIQAGFSLAQYVGDFLGEIGSLGTATPAVAAQIAAKFALNLTTQFLVGTLAMNFLRQMILNKTTVAFAYDAFQGATGADIDAYAMRYGANMVAMSSGGVSQGNNNSIIGLDSALQKEKQQFQSQSFFARMFDVNESRSLVDTVAADVSPSFSQNLLSASHNFLNLGSVLTGGFLHLLPHAAADSDQSADYNWGFPQDGLPDNMKTDPELDFNTNQDAVADLLNSECPNGDMSGSACSALAKRVDACFANSLVYDPGDQTWDAQKETGHKLDPQSDSYQDADCADVGDASNTRANDAVGQWRRMVMFIYDTHAAKTANCFAGDAQSCTDEGSDVLK